VTASDSDTDPRWTAKNAADGGEAPFVSDDAPDQWVCIDFKTLAVTPTAYVLRSVRGGPGSAHPRGWTFETSADGAAWTELDRRRDNQQLNAPDVIIAFEVSSASPARFIRLRQTQTNHAGTHVFAIASFDVIGALSPSAV
jgi:hypothetical protein